MLMVTKRLVRPLVGRAKFFLLIQKTNRLIRPYSRSKVVFIRVSKNRKKFALRALFSQVGESGRFRPQSVVIIRKFQQRDFDCNVVRCD